MYKGPKKRPSLMEILNDPTTIPPKELVWRAQEICPPEKTKVIIIGQDPYPRRQDATGLAFSLTRSSQLTLSVRRIFEELVNDIHCLFPPHGDLTKWAEQGVLLLNSVLTTKEGKIGAHSGVYWEQHTTDEIQKVVDIGAPLVIICWGNKAKEKVDKLKLHSKVLVLCGGHPSPQNQVVPFFGGRYFSKANKWLKSFGLSPIDWRIR